MSISIRKADEQDFPAILSLIKEFSIFQKTPEKVSISLDQMLLEKNYFQSFVAETEDGKIVGFASFFFAYYSWSGKALYLDDLYVQVSHRKQGIGKKLLDSVIEHAKKEKCKKLRWQVSNWNANAISFYRKMGAEIDDIEINCDLCLNGN